MISVSRNSVKQTFKQYILQYRSTFCQRSFDMFYWLVLGIICLEEVRSIKFLYDNFISKYTKKALNSVYFFLSYLDFPIDTLILNTITIILSIIPDSLSGMTIFLTIDDTLQDKYGDKFDCYFKFFDHANKNGSQYLNGHCFVSLVLNIPLYSSDKVRYLSIPVGYRLYSKEKSKLKLASELISSAMSKLNGYQVILLCDSWYSKGDIIETVKSFDNLDMIAAVRSDTAIFDLPPEPTGRKGRPRLKGERLNIENFTYEQVSDYYIANKVVMTRLFDDPVHLTVTTKNITNFSSVRLYISTINPEQIQVFKENTVESLKYDFRKLEQRPLSCYGIRWNIEIIYYQHKFFWSFGNYMVRNGIAIERYVNLLSIAFTFVTVLPFLDKRYKQYRFGSPQTIRRVIADNILKELFFDSFLVSLENNIIYSAIKKAVYLFLDNSNVS